MKYFVSYKYSYLEKIQKQIRLAGDKYVFDKPKLETHEGIGHTFVELNPNMSMKQWDEWTANFEREKAEKILQADFDNRDYLFVVVTNISKLE